MILYKRKAATNFRIVAAFLVRKTYRRQMQLPGWVFLKADGEWHHK
jgi:hypothetical protein